MKIHLIAISISSLSLTTLHAQWKLDEEAPDSFEAAFALFDSRDPSELDETLALLRPVVEEQPNQPVLVTGKPPEDTDLINVAEIAEVADTAEIPVDPEALDRLPPSRPETKGLQVRVERLSAGQGSFEPESVRLVSPFPPKPLHEAPEGWMLKNSSNAPAFKRQVELSPGKAITLTIRPHVLVPDADQARILAVSEPGFEASLGYQQTETVSAALSDSIQQLNEDSKRIGNAIDQLQQLIVSLPKPEPDSASSIPDAATPIPESP